MSESTLSFISRLGLAFQYFFRILFNGEFAGSAARLLTAPEPIEPTAPEVPQQPVLLETDPDSALQLLGLLQQEGRLVDFLEEEVAEYSDAEIGAAVRVVHEGCRKALHDHITLQPIQAEGEGARITLQPGFDASAIRPTGNLVGEPPFTGTLAHRGWRATEVRLPKVAKGHDVQVIAPAEVEL
ncbi:MAG: DUF2760 domain-containing protein [Gammaproteobacteria bacterium]|nr:DUF2760 domain-containing protein [Gammaproteobacteria bacterium]